jgi:RNA polymerase sigma-70 factor (ECF subfamily)
MRQGRPAGATDRQLAASLVEHGDERAFRELYRRHTPRLFQFVLRLMAGVEQDAEDVVQETWLRAAGALDRFRWESSFSTWLTGISVNVCRNLWRRRDGRDLEWDPTRGVPTHELDHPERIDLERAIAALPSGYRAVLILHDLEGLTHAEIGQRLEISAGTSKSQLFAARRAMRALLNADVQPMDGTDG